MEGGEPTLSPPHAFGSAAPPNARAAAATTVARRSVMYVEDYAIQSERTGIRRPGTAAVEGLTGGTRLRASLPDGVWCCLPGQWPLEDGALCGYHDYGDRELCEQSGWTALASPQEGLKFNACICSPFVTILGRSLGFPACSRCVD